MPKILIADDNSNVQKTVALVFQERGVQVVSVGNGEAAVRRIPDLDPDLVLADIFMPVRNGYEVCEFVKKDQPLFAHPGNFATVGAFDPLRDEKGSSCALAQMAFSRNRLFRPMPWSPW